MHTMRNSHPLSHFPCGTARSESHGAAIRLANHRDPGNCRDHGDHEGSDFALAACDRQAKPTLAIFE
jgi:hypothetical protein